MIPWIEESEPLPCTSQALTADSEAPGLLAATRALSIFPWYSQGQPVLWWSPDPRMVLPVAEFKLSRSLRKTLRRFQVTPGCEIRIDADVAGVIEACASPLVVV